MAHFSRPRLNLPAMLRAMADVAEGRPYFDHDFRLELDWNTDALPLTEQRFPTVSASFRPVMGNNDARVELGRAYMKYGGDPSLLLSLPERISTKPETPNY